MASNNPALDLNHHDLCQHASITVKIYGNETSWIADVGGNDPSDAIVLLRSKQLTLMGSLPALEAVVADWTRLLDEARSHPELWDQLPRRARSAGGDGSVPELFVRRADGGPIPSGPASTLQTS